MDPAEQRAMKELEKVAAFQARMAKKNNRQKKIRQLTEENVRQNGQQKGRALDNHIKYMYICSCENNL